MGEEQSNPKTANRLCFAVQAINFTCDPIAIGWSGDQQRCSEIIFLQLPVFLSAVRDQQKFFNIKDCDLAAGCF